MTAALRLLLAPQEFKGSLTAQEAVAAMTMAAARAIPEAQVDELPLSDGGPGLVEVLVAAVRGEIHSVAAHDPLERPLQARFGLIEGGTAAVVELAAASGLSLLRTSELDPLHASTFGTGEVIKAALDTGVRRLIVGIGGSATNDGGAGMVSALGARLLDADGQPLPPGGAALARLARIDISGLDSRLRGLEVIAACDVRNPLTGSEGAAAVYGPQKGATAAMVAELDRALAHYAAVIHRDLGREVAGAPGAGAAGGTGAALLAFLGARLEPGFTVVAEATHLQERLSRADLILTGEGSLDRQTSFGKVVAGLTAIAAAAGVPVIALAGVLGDGYETLLDHGLAAAFSIVPGPMQLNEAVARAAELLSARTEAVLRTVLAGRALAQRQQGLG